MRAREELLALRVAEARQSRVLAELLDRVVADAQRVGAGSDVPRCSFASLEEVELWAQKNFGRCFSGSSGSDPARAAGLYRLLVWLGHDVTARAAMLSRQQEARLLDRVAAESLRSVREGAAHGG